MNTLAATGANWRTIAGTRTCLPIICPFRVIIAPILPCLLYTSAIQGIRSLDKQLITLYPGSVPSKLPSAEFWSKQSFDFDSFEPQVLQQGESIPHLRMDAVLQFLLADRFD